MPKKKYKTKAAAKAAATRASNKQFNDEAIAAANARIKEKEEHADDETFIGR